VRADPAFTGQILDNLVSNAVKYAPVNSTITVSVSREAGLGVVSVADQGPGIPPGKQDELYKKFSKIGNKPTGGEQSVGLGLSIVRQLVIMMGGEIQCISEPGNGARFLVKLPLL